MEGGFRTSWQVVECEYHQVVVYKILNKLTEVFYLKKLYKLERQFSG